MLTTADVGLLPKIAMSEGMNVVAPPPVTTQLLGEVVFQTESPPPVQEMLGAVLYTNWSFVPPPPTTGV